MVGPMRVARRRLANAYCPRPHRYDLAERCARGQLDTVLDSALTRT